VFLGSPAFAVPSLRSLFEHPEIAVELVVTQPDRPAGRGRALTPPPVKIAADELRVPVVQPETLRDPAAVDAIRSTIPDVLVVVAYGELLREDVLRLAPHGCINVHPSLLPQYRGATPIPAAILAGDIITGISIIRLERRLDAGPILAQRECVIEPRDTARSLAVRLAGLAADMLPVTVLDYAAGRIALVPQDESVVSHTREWTPGDARINWSQPAAHIERLVRASDPWPVAWSTIGGNRIRILGAEVDPAPGSSSDPGAIDMTAQCPRVATGDGWLRLILVQPAGKRAMSAADWLRGATLMSNRFDS
jgi:methionyl-tRNA formyltransferase